MTLPSVSALPLGCEPCDHCDGRSKLYAPLTTCRECADRVCSACAEPGSENDDDRTVICRLCWKSFEAENDNRDEDYERAAARARGNDFADTDGRDWT